MRFLTLPLAISLIVIGCSDKKDKASEIIKVKGDPIAFVAKASGNPDHTFSKSFFEKEGNLQVAISGFQEKYEAQTYDEVKADQDPGLEDADTSVSYSLVKMGNGDVEIVPNSTNGFTLVFSKVSGGYNFSAFKYQGFTFTSSTASDAGFQVIHNSSHSSGSAISSLIYSGSAGARVLLNFVVSNSHKKKTLSETISGHYNYMFGRGKKIAWAEPKKIQMSVCGNSHKEYVDLVSTGAREWNRASDNLLAISTSAKANCPPYSDLNTRTFNFVSGFVEFPDRELSMNGVAIVVANKHESTITDGDIFILENDVEGLIQVSAGVSWSFNDENFRKNSKVMSYVQGTVTHEMGHFLGLHHQFDPKYPSIMSYDETKSIQAYDREAIQKLYTR